MINQTTAHNCTPKKGRKTGQNRTPLKGDVRTVRLTNAEVDTLDRLTAQRGLKSRSEAVRLAIRHIDNIE